MYPAVSSPVISQVDVLFKLFMVIIILQDLVNSEEVESWRCGGGGGGRGTPKTFALMLTFTHLCNVHFPGKMTSCHPSARLMG